MHQVGGQSLRTGLAGGTFPFFLFLNTDMDLLQWMKQQLMWAVGSPCEAGHGARRAKTCKRQRKFQCALCLLIVWRFQKKKREGKKGYSVFCL